MINPGTYNITCPQGATWDRTFTVNVGSTRLNLTGYTAAMQVRESADAGTAIISLTNGSGITLGGTAGTIDVVISSTLTAGAASGSYSYDLELNSGGTITRLLEGSFNVTGNVTR
jgi:carbon monoxide dehydrogenase subunit G